MHSHGQKTWVAGVLASVLCAGLGSPLLVCVLGDIADLWA